MLMPKKNRIAIYELLFKVMVDKKDVHMPKHLKLADKKVPNLHIMKAIQVSKVYRLHEGTVCLETFLLVPDEQWHPISPLLPPHTSDIVSVTVHHSLPETGRPQSKGPEGEQQARFTRGEADRDAYRRSAV